MFGRDHEQRTDYKEWGLKQRWCEEEEKGNNKKQGSKGWGMRRQGRGVEEREQERISSVIL